MSQIREPAFDRVVSRVLMIGAFVGFAVMLCGAVLAMYSDSAWTRPIETAGVVVMLGTPLVRVAVVCVLFLREKDWRYSAISFGVLVILLLGAMFGIGER
ncbi:MAG TPA: DUF1634 domain-containing protein [Terriglobales bacterium]|jgi:uncharacterized membrane protein|nr:DUF1634 domain-containing protein [Terriglobales bacterium]